MGIIQKADSGFTTKKYLNKEKSKKDVKNPPFFQLYKHSYEFYVSCLNENPAAMKVWHELVQLMDNQGAVMVSQQSLADFFNVTKRTISNWIGWLEKVEMIHIFKIGTANVYAINSDVISDQLITHKQEFALFSARVVAEKKEQTKKIQRRFFSVASETKVIKQHNIFGGLDEIIINEDEKAGND